MNVLVRRYSCGITELRHVQPFHVAAYIEELQAKRSAPTVKQHLACIRMLFDWLVTGQVVRSNPAHSLRGPRYSVSKGSTPVLSSDEARELLKGMDISTVVGLRDRALIATMTYTFARVGAVVALKVEDYYPQKKRWWLRLHEKNGKLNEMPCHHRLEEYLDAYIAALKIAGRSKGTAISHGCWKDGPVLRRAHASGRRVADGPPPRC
jgi:integrase/recombinase XerD